MKILFFISDLNSGGAEWQLARLAVSLVEKDFNVQVVCMFGTGEVFKYLENNKITVECIDYDRSWKIWKLAKFAKIIRTFKPEIMHTWMFHANIIGKLIGKLCGVPKIIASLRVAEKERSYHVSLDKRTSFMNCKILCNSSGLAKFATKRGFPEEKIEVIPNSFDSELFTFSTRNEPKDGIWKILFLGRVTAQKGLDYLVDGLKDEKLKEYQFHLDITGNAEEKLRNSLKIRIGSSGLDKIIKFKPPVPHDEISALMHNYHILVLPSLWEGMPNVVMEAFASGLPVLATDIEGTNELIENGNTGLLIEAENSPQISDKLKHIFDNYTESIKMAEKAHKELLDTYKPDLIHRQYFDLYSSII